MRELSLVFSSYFFNIFYHYFTCLEHIESLKVKGPDLFFTPYAFDGLNNVTVLDLSESCFDWHYLTDAFNVRANLPKLLHLNLSRSMNVRYSTVIDQDFIDAVSSRPLQRFDLSHNADLIFDYYHSDTLCETLTSVLLHDSFVTENNLPIHCPALKFVDLSGSPNLIRQFKRPCLEKNHIFVNTQLL